MADALFEPTSVLVTKYFRTCAMLADTSEPTGSQLVSNDMAYQMNLEADGARNQLGELARSASDSNVQQLLERLVEMGEEIRSRPLAGQLSVHASAEFFRAAGRLFEVLEPLPR